MLNTTSTTDFSAFAAPIQKLIDLNTAALNKAFQNQQSAAESQMNLLQERTKAAMEIKDQQDLNAFLNKQAEITKASLAELSESSKTAAEDMKAYFAEVQAILSQK